jgi:hypothetical protein
MSVDWIQPTAWKIVHTFTIILNTFQLGYKNQSTYDVSGTNRCSFSDKYKTLKYSLVKAYDYWMLNLLVHHVTGRFWKAIIIMFRMIPCSELAQIKRTHIHTFSTKVTCATGDIIFYWPCITVYQYSESNAMHFLFNLLRIKGLYMFRALLAHPQEVPHKQHLIYCKQ